MNDTGRKIVVLIVNDQKMICEVVRRMVITEPDFDFHYCLEASKAIETAIEVSPTVILQDLIMPDIDGLSLLREYRTNPMTMHIPIIVLSSEENTQIKADAFALDANDYLNKLPDKVELLARLRHHSKGYIERLEIIDRIDTLLMQRDLVLDKLNIARELFETLGIGIITLASSNSNFSIMSLNSPIEKMFGHNSISDIVGHPVEQVMPSIFTPEILDALNRADLSSTAAPLFINNGKTLYIRKQLNGEIIVAVPFPPSR